jgi:predicted component of type VI protein secretion system
MYVSPVALQSLKDPGRHTYRRFLELFKRMVGLLGRVISPSQGLYLHRTTQHRKTRTNVHALSGIRTHDPSNQSAKTHASDRTATVTGCMYVCPRLIATKLMLCYSRALHDVNINRRYFIGLCFTSLYQRCNRRDCVAF